LNNRRKNMKNGKYLVGIVGIGGIGRVHIEGWKKIGEVEIYGISDVRPDFLDDVSKKYEIPVAVKNYKDLLKVAEIDIIDVCTPNAFHYPITIDALNAGKHVICEKPIATKSQHVKKMIETSKKNKKKLMTAQHQRFFQSSQMIKKIIDDDILGEIYFAICNALRRRELPARDTFIKKELSGGGPLFDIGVHMLDLVYWFMGCPDVDSVKAVTFAKLAKMDNITGSWGHWDRKKIDVEDFAAGFIVFKDGRALQLTCSFLSNLPSNWSAHLYGTKSGIIWPEMKFFSEISGFHQDSSLTPIVVDNEPPHHKELKHFLECVKNDKEVLVKPEESLKVIEILEAMYKSAETGKEIHF